MTNAELADALNRDLQLSGGDAVTVNVIRQWVLWGVLPRASATASAIGKSPDWHRDDRASRRAHRLTELRKAGIRRESAVIAQAFLEWGHADIERCRKAIVHEYAKGRAQMLKGVTTDLEFADYNALRAPTRRALRNQAGPLDARLIGTQFEQSAEFYAVALKVGNRGKGDPQQIAALLLDAFSRMLPMLSTYIDAPMIETLGNSIVGIFGIPDEIDNSAQTAIEMASPRQLRVARHVTRRGLKAIRNAHRFSELVDLPELAEMKDEISDLANQLTALSPQITIGPWAVFMLAQTLLAAIAKKSDFRIEIEG